MVPVQACTEFCIEWQLVMKTSMPAPAMACAAVSFDTIPGLSLGLATVSFWFMRRIKKLSSAGDIPNTPSASSGERQMTKVPTALSGAVPVRKTTRVQGSALARDDTIMSEPLIWIVLPGDNVTSLEMTGTLCRDRSDLTLPESESLLSRNVVRLNAGTPAAQRALTTEAFRIAIPLWICDLARVAVADVACPAASSSDERRANSPIPWTMTIAGLFFRL